MAHAWVDGWVGWSGQGLVAVEQKVQGCKKRKHTTQCEWTMQWVSTLHISTLEFINTTGFEHKRECASGSVVNKVKVNNICFACLHPKATLKPNAIHAPQ